MLHSLKRFWLVLALFVAGAHSVFGFALLGPVLPTPDGEPWQTPAAGFGLPGDDGGPKDLGDGYRWSTPTLYYACDASFADYFGTNGLAAIDQAFAVFNNLTNFSRMSTNLTEFPTTSTRFNFTAVSLQLLDLKSEMMARIANMLGLAAPERYTWNIHDRYTFGNAPCPLNVNYVVVQRNFDPVTQTYSSYVNGQLIDYAIDETCGMAAIPPDYFTVPLPVDPLTVSSTAVADGQDSGLLGSSRVPGRYYTGLTRDDVGGLRYLYNTNRINTEAAPAGTLAQITNQQAQVLVTMDLATLEAQSLSNNAAALQALYPGLNITSETNFFTVAATTNFVPTIFLPPNQPVGTFQIVLTPVVTTNVESLFLHTFGNVVIVNQYTNGFVTTTTTTTTVNPNAPFGTGIHTNTTSSTTVQNFLNGDFYILPTNSCAPFVIITNLLTTLIPITNFSAGTNATIATNLITSTATTVTYFTNHTLLVYPVICLTSTNSATLREGIDHITFVRRDFDSIIGSFWPPITNSFTSTAISNGVSVSQSLQRVVTQPDILIGSRDIIVASGSQFFVLTVGVNQLNFTLSPFAPDGFGPGNIEPPITFFFGKGGGPIFLNGGGNFVQAGAQPFFQWGSFDGSTNAPVAYPDGSSLAGLDQQIFYQISTTLLPNYSVSGNSGTNAYNALLQASGGTAPYVWSMANNTVLPPGLNLSSSGVISGHTTAAAGTTYDFTVQATDFGSRVTQGNLFITITP